MDPDRRGRLADWYKSRPDDASPGTGIKPTANSRGEINDDYDMSVEDANNNSENKSWLTEPSKVPYLTLVRRPLGHQKWFSTAHNMSDHEYIYIYGCTRETARSSAISSKGWYRTQTKLDKFPKYLSRTEHAPRNQQSREGARSIVQGISKSPC